MNINEILKKCQNKKVTITFFTNDEGQLREISGILVKLTEQVITLKIFDNYGDCSLYHINRHSCVLHSVIEEEMK